MGARNFGVVICVGLGIISFGAAYGASDVQADVEALRQSLRGASGNDALNVRQEPDGRVGFLATPMGGYFETPSTAPGAEAAARGFLNQHRAALGIAPDVGFSVMRVRKTNGRTYVRFQQTYSGLPVFGAQVNVQLNPAGKVVSVLSDIMRDTSLPSTKSLSVVPTLTAAAAQRAGVDFMAGEYPGIAFQALRPALVVYDPSVLGAPGNVCLAWKMEVRGVSALIREMVLIDAHTGGVALHYTLVQAAKNRMIYDADNTTADPGTLSRKESDPPSAVTDVNLAYDYLGDTYDFYHTRHGRDSIDNMGMTLSATVRFCWFLDDCPMMNAFWAGTRMYFGEGLAVDDVTAHELTHGVTDYESQLVYAYESGAINESFSDIWGEFVDLTNGAGYDAPTVRWLIGEETPIGAFRSMSDPTMFGDPDRMHSPYYYRGPYDNGGVHWNCGVGNKLCYLLTDGDTFNGYTVVGMGIDKVADLYYEVQTNILTASANYGDLAAALLQAASNLGFTVSEINNVYAGCLAVELMAEMTWPFRATSITGSPYVVLTWPTPSGSAFDKVSIVRKAGGFPESRTDGALVYEGKAVRAIDGPLPQGNEYFYGAFFQYTSSSANHEHFARATVGAPTPNHLSEQFIGGPDIAYTQILFTPVGDLTTAHDSGKPASYVNYTNYTASVVSGPLVINRLPVSREGSIPIPLPDDEWDYLEEPNFLRIDLPEPFPFFGVNYYYLLLSPNGYITTPDFGSGYSLGNMNVPSYARHFAARRISFLFANLAPDIGGEAWAKFMQDRFVITFEHIPEAGSYSPNTVQAELFYSGHIRITYLELNLAGTTVCGLSDGNGMPLNPLDVLMGVPSPSPLMSNLSSDFPASTFSIYPSIPPQEVDEGELVSFVVRTTAPAGNIPVFEVRESTFPNREYPNPFDMSLINNGNGTATFTWQTGPESDGVYGVLICATLDGQMVCQEVHITVGDVYALPIATDLTIVPASPGTNDVLVGSYTYFQLEGFPEAGSPIRWFRNGGHVPVFDNLLTIPPAATRFGDRWYFTVWPYAARTTFERMEIITGEVVASPIVLIRASGDVNGDGDINAADVQLVVEAILGRNVGSARTDVNGDGFTNSVDLMLVIRALFQI